METLVWIGPLLLMAIVAIFLSLRKDRAVADQNYERVLKPEEPTTLSQVSAELGIARRYSDPDSSGVVFDRQTHRYVALTAEQLEDAGLTLPAKSFTADDMQMQAMAEELGGRWFPSKLVGCTFRNEDGSLRQKIVDEASEGDRLELEREPDNEHDPNAVKVVTAFGEQLGYLDGRLAGEVSRGMANGQSYRCYLKRKTGGDGEKLGAVLAIVIWRDGPKQ